MPRKTNGIEFEVHPRPTKGDDGKPLLYVRPVKGRKKTFKDLEAFCSKYRGLRTGELQQVFGVVMEVAGMWLSDGYRVETPLGSFAPKLKLLGEHTDPKTIHGRDIRYAGLEFIPSKDFVEEGGRNREGYRRSNGQVGNSQMYDAGAMDNLLDDEECSLTLYQESEKDECVIEVWNCIIDAVAYICRKIYEEQGVDYFPEPIELVDEDTYSRLLAGYEKCMKQ